MNLDISTLFAFGAMICWAIGDFFIQRTTRKIGDIEALAFMGLIGAIALAPFVFEEIELLFELQNILIIFFLSIAAVIGAVLNFEALKQGKLSVVEIILQIELPVTVILGLIFFKESLSPIQATFISLIVCGTFMIVAGSKANRLIKGVEKGALLAALAAIALGFVNFLTAAGSRQISPILIIWTPWFLAAVLSFLFLIKRDGINIIVKKASKFRVLIIAMGVFETAAWLLFSLAVFSNSLSITIAISQSYPAICLFLGIKINKEEITKQQYIGATIALVSSFILGFLS